MSGLAFLMPICAGARPDERFVLGSVLNNLKRLMSGAEQFGNSSSKFNYTMPLILSIKDKVSAV